MSFNFIFQCLFSYAFIYGAKMVLLIKRDKKIDGAVIWALDVSTNARKLIIPQVRGIVSSARSAVNSLCSGLQSHTNIL